VKFQSNFEGRPETWEPLPSNANCWDSVLAILPGWTRACVLFYNTWHIACHYSLSWWTSLVCLSLVDMKKKNASIDVMQNLVLSATKPCVAVPLLE
jgi:hypothetical protein